MTKPDLLSVIDRIQRECAEPNWDSYQASPVKAESVAHAKRLIESLPDDLPLPSACPECDGCIALEWCNENRDLVSASVNPSGDLSWAALVGEVSTCGVSRGGWDENLLAWVRRLIPAP